MTEPKLKPCPFCGANVGVVTNVRELEDCANFEEPCCPHYFDNKECDGGFVVVCAFNDGGCGASSGYRQTEAEAIEAWNKRVPKNNYEEAFTALAESITSGVGGKVAE